MNKILFEIVYPKNKNSIFFSMIGYLGFFLILIYILIDLLLEKSLSSIFIFLFTYVVGYKVYFLILSIQNKKIMITDIDFKIKKNKKIKQISLDNIYYVLHEPRDSVFGDGRIIKFYEIKNKKKKFLFDFCFDNLGEENRNQLIDILTKVSGRNREDFLNRRNTDKEKYQAFPLVTDVTPKK